MLATTLGETGGDTVRMTFHWGYLAGTALFAVLLAVCVACRSGREIPPGAVLGHDRCGHFVRHHHGGFFDRSLGIGYTGGSLAIFACLMTVLGLGTTKGTIAVETVSNPKTEAFYWVAITFSQTLGTALGDWTSNVAGLGFGGGAVLFVGALVVLAVLYYTTDVSRVLLFWAAFILTRPLGATFGDLLDKPVRYGGLDVSRPLLSVCIAAFMAVCILVLPQRAGRHPGRNVSPG